MQAKELTVDKILATGAANEHYHVPKYQRPYSWKKSNWEEFYDDIEDNDPGHFIGSVICVDDKSLHTPGKEHVYEVIDGQQRLATISLLYCAIAYKFNENNDRDKLSVVDKKIIDRSLMNVSDRLVKGVDKKEPSSIQVNGDNYILRMQPTSQNNNLNDYLFILHDAGIVGEVNEIAYCSARGLYKAYDYFYERLPNAIKKLKKFLDKLDAVTLVHITVPSHSDAFKLFETLNNRGVPLTAVDIVKNKMLSVLGKDSEKEVDAAYDNWQKIVNNVTDSDQNRFLRQFYNAFKYDGKIKVKEFPGRITASNLIKVYEKLIDRNAKYLIDRLIDASKDYKIINSDSPADSDDDSVFELNMIGATPSHMLILYLMNEDVQDYLDEGVLEHVVSLLCKYYIRRNLSDYPGTRELDQLHIDMIETINKHIAKSKRITKKFINEIFCSVKYRGLDELVDLLNGGIYDDNSWMARYLLIYIDDLAKTREYSPDLWKRDRKGKFIWTVEHIFPQGENIPVPWIKLIANGDADKAEEVRQRSVHMLGNLTLSAYNSKLSTKPFLEKQKLSKKNIAGESLKLGYQNRLYLNNLKFKNGKEKTNLATIKTWNEKCINARTKIMVDILIHELKFPWE